MDKVKIIWTPLARHIKLSTRHCLSTYGEDEDLKKYASGVCSLMSAMVCTRPDIFVELLV